MTPRPRAILFTLSALLAALAIIAASLAAYAVACTTESHFPTKEEQEAECNPALIEMSKCLIADPVNAATGNLAEEQTDIAPLGGRGPTLGIAISYNSQAAARTKEAGPYGFGWTGPYSATLSFNKEAESATVRQDNGSTAVFYKKAGKYAPPAWDISSLKES